MRPNELHSFAFSKCINPYIHFDLFYNPLREKSYIPPWNYNSITNEDKKLAQPNMMQITDYNLPYEVIPANSQEIDGLFNRCIYLFSSSVNI